jgi:threonine dehydrogenase-like Zn-dependent dehydrogenase
VAVSNAQPIPVVAVGVCGSDVQRYRTGFAIRSLGHELVGRTPDGALVAVRPLEPCRSCPACQRGWTEQCATDTSIGRHDTGAGGFSGTVYVHPHQLYPVPEDLPLPLATLADPLACIVHALYGIDLNHATLLVVGDGPMAALAAIYSRRLGAQQITLAVKVNSRIERMCRFGDRVVTSSDVRPDHYDVVVESVGGVNNAAILTAVTAVAPMGQLVALGVYSPEATADLPVRRLLEKESTLRGSKAYRVSDDRDDFATALALIESKTDDFAPIITATPAWSPTSQPPPVLERRNDIKIVYVNTSQ